MFWSKHLFYVISSAKEKQVKAAFCIKFKAGRTLQQQDRVHMVQLGSLVGSQLELH